ncbi:MAG TPA: serine/threonine-protein kinase [Ktedonobacteraceae bacterium]|nr:serine/threonine-protein kinase [Ktedonobacteraceae bacterium]
MDDRVGKQFGDYQIVRLLGEGGSAEVYLGKHVHLRSLAAIKVLRTKLVARERDTFMREARIIAELDHPAIVRVLDSGFDQECPYVVMNYAPGGTLRQRHPEGSRLPLGQVVTYVVQVAAALQYAHERQLIHRDVKPENMLLGRDDQVLLGDFGIALVSSASITQQGSQAMAGSVAYMAPEQIMGKPEVASDQYALAVVAYEWLTGEQLFQGTFAELCAQHLYAPPPPLQEKNSTVTSAAEDILMKALAKEPMRRFASIQEFAEALAQSASEDAVEVSSLPDMPPLEEAVDGESEITLRRGESIDWEGINVVPLARDGSVQGWARESDGYEGYASMWRQAQGMSLRVGEGESGSEGEQEEDTDKRAAVVALKTLDTGEQEQARPFHVDEEGERALPFFSSDKSERAQAFSQRVVDTPVFSFPALSEGWREKLSGLPLWNGFVGSWGSVVGLKKRKVVIAASLLALLLVSGVAYALPRIDGKGAAQVATPTAPPLTAAVTITPQQKQWSKSYALSAVMGTPDATKHQVQAHWLSITTAAQARTVKATGVKVVPGTGVAASGILTFDNGAPVPLTFNQGTVLTNTLPNAKVQQVVLDAPLTVAAASPTQPHVQASVMVHVVQIGAIGNIASSQFEVTGMAGGATMPNWMAFNAMPFAGGVDKQTTPFVKQSDIDSAAQALIQADAPDPLQVLKPQLAATDRLVGQGWCTPNKSADHQAKEQAAMVTVSVSFTCVGDVYNRERAALLATSLLSADMKAAHYIYVDTPKVMVTQQSIVDDQGTIALQVQAQVNGTYSFAETDLQALARQIAGKSVTEAKNWLEQQAGVGKATITLAGGTSKVSLPARVQNITVSIAA